MTFNHIIINNKTNELHELSSVRAKELCEQFQIARDERNQAVEALKDAEKRLADVSLSDKEREEAAREKDIRQTTLNESNQKVKFFETLLKKFAEIVEPLTDSLKKAASIIGKNLEAGIQKAGPILEKAIEVLADRAVAYVLSKMFGA
jgi:Na+/phosphate symporter